MRAMREAVGEAIDIMVDCHARPSPRMGLRFAQALEPYGLYLLEEPCWPESVDDLALIQRAVTTPIATGERLVGQHAFRELLERRACSVLQPDITHCGGLSEARRIAAMAEAYRVALAPHNPQGPVSTAASLEFGFATPSTSSARRSTSTCPGEKTSSQRASRSSPRAAWSAPVRGPASGSRSTKPKSRRHPFQQELEQRVFYPDGSVGDW